VKRLLDEASASQYDIDHGQRHRMQDGILHIHWEEWSRLRKMYNHETLLRAFSSRHPVVSASAYLLRPWERRSVSQMENDYAEINTSFPTEPILAVKAGT
jgi:hypothetical protein